VLNALLSYKSNDTADNTTDNPGNKKNVIGKLLTLLTSLTVLGSATDILKDISGVNVLILF
jgi:hypothetical protein